MKINPDEYCYFDPATPEEYETIQGGIWFYRQDKPGAPWFDKVDNGKGWTVDFNLELSAVDNSGAVSSHAMPDGMGFYINDGTRQEVIYFFEQEIVFKYAKRVFVYDTTSSTHYRLIGKRDSMSLFARKENESIYRPISEVSFLTEASSEGNASRPSVCQDTNGIVHAVWHDDGSPVGQIYYSFYKDNAWSEPELIASSGFSAKNAQIDCDKTGKVAVVYEAQRRSGSDILFTYREDGHWSAAKSLTDGSSSVSSASLSFDEKDDLHIVYQDDISGLPQIHYVLWNHQTLGFSNVDKVTSADYGAINPKVTTYADRVYVSYTQQDERETKISITFKRTGSEWSSVVNVSSYRYADYSDLLTDVSGKVFIVWQDYNDRELEIYSRIYNPNLLPISGVQRLTDSSNVSQFPRIASHNETGDIYVVWEDLREIDPDVDPSSDPDKVTHKPKIYVAKYSYDDSLWHSEAQGEYDIRVETSADGESYRPVVPKRFTGQLHIVHESLYSHDRDEYFSTRHAFKSIRDVLYDLSLDAVYYPLDEVYYEKDVLVSGAKRRAELRFGDFSSVLGVKFTIKYLRYYLNDAVPPFSIKPIEASNFGLDSLYSTDAAVNNYGDIWLSTLCGAYFYFNRDNTLFEARSDASDKLYRSIVFDNNNNMFLADRGNVYYSLNHFESFSSAGITGSSISDMTVDKKNRLWVSFLEEGVKGYEIEHLGTSLSLTMIASLGADDLPSVAATSVESDDNNSIWIGTRKGLVRYYQGRTFVYKEEDGLSSNRINDIAIQNTNLRYIATANGIDRMFGTSFEKIGADDGDIYNNNVKSVEYREPGVLWAGTLSNISQLTIENDDTVVSTYFSPNSYSSFQNDLDDKNLFFILSDEQISTDSIIEVYLNGNRISYGYSFSIEDNSEPASLKFDTNLKDTDIVDVVVRTDAKVFASFAQDEVEIAQFGSNVVRVNEIVADEENIFVSTTGDENEVKFNDAALPYPFDTITVDRTPPDGCLRIIDQIDSTTLRVAIDQPDSGFYDEVSGIDKLVLSNYPNFTTDGTTPQTPVNFTSITNVTIPEVVNADYSALTFDSEKGLSLFYFEDSGEVYATTKEPGKVYKLNTATNTWEEKLTFGADSIVEFVAKHNNSLLIAVGDESGDDAKLYSYADDGSFAAPFEFVASGSRLYDYAVLGNNFYIGNNMGEILLYDGFTLEAAFSDLSSHVFGLTASKNVLYAVTGNAGLVYRIDPEQDVEPVMIVHSDSDSQILSIEPLTIDGKNLLFMGTGSSGTILRTNVASNSFNKSFQTTSIPISALHAATNSVIAEDKRGLYAAIGQDVYLFTFDASWVFQHKHTETISDIAMVEDTLFIISESGIYQIEETTETRSVYMKLIDKAGNESSLYGEDGDVIPCYFASIDISDLQSLNAVYLENRIFEIDEFGDNVYTLTADSPFYSGKRIDEQVGTYESQVFDGTNFLVKWDSIVANYNAPEGTSIQLQVRSGSTENEVKSAEWSEPFTPDSGSSVGLDALSGTLAQFRVVFTTTKKGISPTLSKVSIRSVTSESAHFFTTNFVLPSNIKRGLLTAESLTPISSEIVFGINTSNSVKWENYQTVANITPDMATTDLNRIFDVKNLGDNLRVGIKFITPSRSNLVSSVYDEYGPYNSPLLVNSIDFNFVNSESSGDFDFRVSFYNDVNLTDKVYENSTSENAEDWSADSESFPQGGVTLANGDSAEILLSVPGTTSLSCNEFYFIKLEYNNGIEWKTIQEDRAFILGCSPSFIDEIDFDFTNSGSVSDFHFRVRYYEDGERTQLIKTDYSGNNRKGWTVDSASISEDGVEISQNQTVEVFYTPDLTQFEANKLYHLIIDAYDGSGFTLASKSYTFQINSPDSVIYCGPYVGVPVVKNFGLQFELVDDQLAMLNLI